MAGINNVPLIVHDGLMAYFNRDSVTVGSTTTTFGWQYLGTVEERSVKVDSMAEKIYDDSSGKSRLLTTVKNGFDHSYELTAPNVSLVLKEIFLQSNPATAPSPALPGGTSTDVPQVFNPGQPVAIVDATGKRVYNITTLTNVKVGSTVLQLGVDYGVTQQSLAAGFITILPTSTTVTAAATAGTISYVSGAVTGLVQLKPGSGPCCVQGQAEIHSITCGQIQSVDSGYFSIDISDYMLDPKKTSRTKLLLDRLWDPTGTYPDKFVQYKNS